MKIKKVEPSIGLIGKITNLFSKSKNDTYSCDYLNDKTVFVAKYKETSYADIVAAHEAGKTVIAIRDEYQYQLYSVTDTRCVFGTLYELTSKFLIVNADSSWSNDTETLQKNLVFNTAYDKTTNKVATVKDLPTKTSQLTNDSGYLTNDYSTEEQIIGTWIDGKPIYRKYVSLGRLIDCVYNSWTSLTDVSSLHIKNLIDCKLFSNNNCIWTGALTRINSGNIEVFNGISTWTATNITIEYTKTTD